jgi:hypothetical protein
MASRESSLGAWADKIPRVDGWAGPATWAKAEYNVPLTPDAVGRELRQAGVLFMMGLAALVVAGGLVALDLDVILHGETTTGTLVELRPAPKGCYAPVATFTVAGQRYRVQGDVASKTRLYEVGDPIPVRYHPDDPTNAAIGGFFQLYLFPTIIASLGLGFVLLAVGCGVHILRRASRELAA